MILIYGFLPTVNPGVKNEQSFGARIEAGKNEIDKELQGDLNRLEKKLIGTGKAQP